MADLGWPELTIIAVTFVLLFGWKKMPDMARSVGRSVRIFRSEVDELHADGQRSSSSPTSSTTLPTPTTATTPTTYAAPSGSLAEAEARAAAADAEVTAAAAEAEVASLRAQIDLGRV